MRVVVNCRFLTQPITGVQQYALKLSNFLKNNFEGPVDFVAPKGIVHENLARELEVKTIGNTRGFFWEQVELPFWLKKEGNPLLINFGNVAPQYYAKQIVTIHDLATLEHPEWFSAKFARAYKFMIPQVIHHAKHIIAVSNFTKQRLVDLLGVSPEKISVVYNSVDSTLVDKSLRTPSPYFLSVGSFSGRKNFITLVNAFLMANLPGYQLKIRGDDEDIYRGDEDLKAIIGSNNQIHFIEPLNYMAYLELMRNATGLVNTSMYEGFGMPNLEALSLGVPVICSDIPVFREVGGNLPRYVDPLSAEVLAEQLQYLVGNEPTVYDRRKMMEQAGLFKIEVEGKKLVDLILNCLNEH